VGKWDVLPPRKKDWKPGKIQLGLFIRFENGGKIEFAVNEATPAEAGAAIRLLTELSQTNRHKKP
jgi:hypothetical protein